MNRSSRKANAANASGSRTWARQLLHAFADAGQPPGTGLRLHVGPDGVLVWAEAPQVDRSEPYVAACSLFRRSRRRWMGKLSARRSPRKPLFTLPFESPVSN
jgi:hypothetical protein